MERIAVVTGAASGIGEAVARRLLAGGWNVVALDRRFDPGLAPAAGMLKGGCDVSDAGSVEASFATIEARLGHVDALICSAGVLRTGALCEMAPADFDLVYAVNTRGPWLCARSAVKLMRRSPHRELLPRIVFVGSIGGIRPKIGGGAYGAQKAALHTLTGVLAAELGPEGMLVNAVAPGTVDTPMIRSVTAAGAGGRYRPSGASPLGRVAQPDDVAAVIEFCLGPQASYVTGTVIPVDGGTRAAFIPS
jgi:3-oxoacyl-[acyl-carrier protein] reductase